MRQIFLSIFFLVGVFAHAAAQTKTAEPGTTAAQSARRETNASRNRVVGPKAENHAEKPSLNARQLSNTSPNLIQKTAMVTAISTPIRANVSAGSLPAPAASRLYRVGVGDVLDIRLANTPTPSSTLLTAMRNGTIELPLLN